MRVLYIYLIMALASTSLLAFDHSHSKWSKLLNQHLDAQGSVDYKTWQTKQKTLDEYLASLESVSLKEYNMFNPQQKKAFLINAYNAFTIKLILKHYPIKSIKKIGGFFTNPWKIEFFSLLDGAIKSLDPLEHEWLRKKPELKDPRVHAAVNCASISCPRLNATAFQANSLEEQLDEATRAWLTDSTRNHIAPKELKLSKIFDWFADDFGSDSKSIIKFIAKYLEPKLGQQISANHPEISYLDYDWGINER